MFAISFNLPQRFLASKAGGFVLQSALMMAFSCVSPLWGLMQWALEPYLNWRVFIKLDGACLEEVLRFMATLHAHPTMAEKMIGQLLVAEGLGIAYLLATSYLSYKLAPLLVAYAHQKWLQNA